VGGGDGGLLPVRVRNRSQGPSFRQQAKEFGVQGSVAHDTRLHIFGQ
jgi:hypothetical protein